MPLFAFEGHQPDVSPEAWIAPTATLLGDVRVEAGASVWYGAVLRADFGPILVRRGANVQDGSVLHGGDDPVTEVGEGATIGHLCMIHGAVIGAEALIGNGATVLDGARVGSRALIAGGATVPPGMTVPDGMLAAGVPARVAGEVKGRAAQWVETNPEVYRELARRHSAGARPAEPEGPGFGTMQLPDAPDAVAPDGSDVRVLLWLGRGSMAHFELGTGRVSRAVTHRSVDEIWYVVAGHGQMWRRQAGRQETVTLAPGTCVSIPVGTHFQFRATDDGPLAAVGVTMPPWPGTDEAYEVPGPWAADGLAGPRWVGLAHGISPSGQIRPARLLLTMGTMTFGGSGPFKNVGTTDVTQAGRQIDMCLEAGVSRDLADHRGAHRGATGRQPGRRVPHPQRRRAGPA